MTDLTTTMVRQSLDAFVNLDTRLARLVCRLDDEVDRYNDEIIDELIQTMQQSPEMVEPGLSLFSATRHLERIADHATNIAEDVIYLVEGEIVRHRPAAVACRRLRNALQGVQDLGLNLPRLRGTPRGTPYGTQPRILIIEDERALTDVLTYNLQREGYETLVAHDGQEGLRKAQTLLPDLILLDLMLPAMSGLDVCRELRAGERTRDIPISC